MPEGGSALRVADTLRMGHLNASKGRDRTLAADWLVLDEYLPRHRLPTEPCKVERERASRIAGHKHTHAHPEKAVSASGSGRNLSMGRDGPRSLVDGRRRPARVIPQVVADDANAPGRGILGPCRATYGEKKQRYVQNDP